MHSALLLMVLLSRPLSEAIPAAFVSGNQLLESCTASQFDAQGICLGYVLGVVDSLSMPYVCLPAHIIGKQLQDIVTIYLRDHPASRHQPASLLTADAVASAFPCVPEDNSGVGRSRPR